MIYADYNGSAPLCDEVINYLKERYEKRFFANPNAIHFMGQQILMTMENSRATLAKLLGTKPKNLILNSGATEGISQIFHSLCYKRENLQRNTILISGIEHSAILNNADYWAKNENLEIITVETLTDGVVNLAQLTSIIEEKKDSLLMVAVMAANNETGIIQPYKEIASLCQKSNIPYLCDTTQLIGKVPFNFDDSGIDFAVTSGHKFGAQTGTGIILSKNPSLLKPFVIGGGQEKGLRGGTQNYIGFETMAVALSTFQEKWKKAEALKEKRAQFENRIKSEYPQAVIIGENSPRMATTTYIAFPGVLGQAVQIELESLGIYVTTSSACSDNEASTSNVLKSMGVTDDIGRGVVRISLGLCSQVEDYDAIGDALIKAYQKLSKIKIAN